MTDGVEHKLDVKAIKTLLGENRLLRLALRRCTMSSDPETAQIARDALRGRER